MIGYTKDNIKDYRLGFLMDKADNSQAVIQIAFRYNKLSREDINRINVLKNMLASEYTLTIRTLSVLPFKTSDKVKLDNAVYRIKSIYTEEQENINDGVITKTSQSYKYLVLVK